MYHIKCVQYNSNNDLDIDKHIFVHVCILLNSLYSQICFEVLFAVWGTSLTLSPFLMVRTCSLLMAFLAASPKRLCRHKKKFITDTSGQKKCQ